MGLSAFRLLLVHTPPAATCLLPIACSHRYRIASQSAASAAIGIRSASFPVGLIQRMAV